jgi:hypothetical protein
MKNDKDKQPVGLKFSAAYIYLSPALKTPQHGMLSSHLLCVNRIGSELPSIGATNSSP